MAIDVLPKNNNIVVVAGLHEKVVEVFVVSPEIALIIVAAFSIVWTKIVVVKVVGVFVVVAKMDLGVVYC